MNTSIQLKWGLSEAINYVKRVKMNELIKNWSVKQGVRIGIGPDTLIEDGVDSWVRWESMRRSYVRVISFKIHIQRK